MIVSTSSFALKFSTNLHISFLNIFISENKTDSIQYPSWLYGLQFFPRISCLSLESISKVEKSLSNITCHSLPFNNEDRVRLLYSIFCRMLSLPLNGKKKQLLISSLFHD